MQMKPVDPMTACAGDRAKDGCEYDGLMVQQSGRPSTIPAKADGKGPQMQVLFGGKEKA
jgi:hypothetical protein